MANEWVRGTFSVDAVGSGHTAQNVINGFTSFLTQCGWQVPAWSTNSLDRYFVRTDHGTSDVWWYNGDGPTQKCGIRIFYNSGSSRFEISCFIENTAANGSQKTTNSAHVIYVSWDTTAPNNWLLIGGEHGLYLEVGRDGNPNNLGHAFIGTHVVIPEFYTVRSSADKWNSQGFCCDLVGQLKFSQDRGYVFVTNDGTSRCFTAYLRPFLCRGSSNLATASPADDPRYALTHRMVQFGCRGDASSNAPTTGHYQLETFGLSFSPINGKYIVSQLMLRFDFGAVYSGSQGIGATTSTATNNYGGAVIDPRNYRQVKRFAAVDYTLLGFSNIQDAVTGTIYRVGKYTDGGRAGTIGVEWPATIVTPSVV
jgi:hypothetical protein